MSMEYYMKVYICVDDYYMNDLVMNYYMNAYVVRCNAPIYYLIIFG